MGDAFVIAAIIWIVSTVIGVALMIAGIPMLVVGLAMDTGQSSHYLTVPTCVSTVVYANGTDTGRFAWTTQSASGFCGRNATCALRTDSLPSTVTAVDLRCTTASVGLIVDVNNDLDPGADYQVQLFRPIQGNTAAVSIEFTGQPEGAVIDVPETALIASGDETVTTSYGTYSSKNGLAAGSVINAVQPAGPCSTKKCKITLSDAYSKEAMKAAFGSSGRFKTHKQWNTLLVEITLVVFPDAGTSSADTTFNNVFFRLWKVDQGSSSLNGLTIAGIVTLLVGFACVCWPCIGALGGSTYAFAR